MKGITQWTCLLWRVSFPWCHVDVVTLGRNACFLINGWDAMFSSKTNFFLSTHFFPIKGMDCLLKTSVIRGRWAIH